MQLSPPTIILATDDPRLQRKAEHIFASSLVTLMLTHDTTTILSIVDDFLAVKSPAQHLYCCIDLDAKSFKGYELARALKEDLGEKAHLLHIIGASFGIEPATVQQTKLHRIDTLLQRFALEKLLRTLAEETRSQ